MKVKVDEDRIIHAKIHSPFYIVEAPARVLHFSDGHTPDDEIIWNPMDELFELS